MTSATATAELVVNSLKAMETPDLDASRKYNHPECVNREAGTEPPACRQPGPDGAYATALWLNNLSANIHWDIHEVIAQGDLAAVHATMRGHQSNEHVRYDADGNPAQTMPNHGREFAVTQTHWFRLRDGLIIEHWANRDDLTMAMQLGWLGRSPA